MLETKDKVQTIKSIKKLEDKKEVNFKDKLGRRVFKSGKRRC